MITVPAKYVMTASTKKPSSMVKPFDLYARARMTILPIATMNAMPSKTPMVACALMSLIPDECTSVRGHLEGCLANLWRRTRRCCSTTRHLHPKFLELATTERGRGCSKSDSRPILDTLEMEGISRMKDEEREAAKLVVLSGERIAMACQRTRWLELPYLQTAMQR